MVKFVLSGCNSVFIWNKPDFYFCISVLRFTFVPWCGNALTNHYITTTFI